jgi:molybdopterin synthase catalytic subunit
MVIEIILTESPIAPQPILASGRETGAIVEFQGFVRESEGDVKITGLYYDVYFAMARSQLELHLHELGALHSCDAVTFIHRIGFVPVGSASVWIRVMAKHRGPAFSLCSELLERLKMDIPIWKSVTPNAANIYSQQFKSYSQAEIRSNMP